MESNPMTVYRQSANPNATNSELDAKKIVKNVQLTSNQKDELIESYVELLVDSMSMDDLISYVSEDLCNYCEKLTDNELKEEISLTLDDDMYDELVDNVTQQYPKQLNQFGG